MKFVFVDNETEGGRVWIVEAPDKHNAIATAVKEGYSEDMADFYYGFEDGQISIHMIEKEIGRPDEPATPEILLDFAAWVLSNPEVSNELADQIRTLAHEYRSIKKEGS